MATVEAWVLYNLRAGKGRPTGLQRECITFSDLEPDEVLVEPLYGCWEGNMGHALARKPIDIGHLRGEDRVVIGNAGVVRVLRPGSSVTEVREGDVCVSCSAVWDKHGFTKWAFAYDAPGTVGFLAKRTKMKANQLTRVPRDSRFSLAQWAAFSVRYFTAWTNWAVAAGCYNSMRPRTPGFDPIVWGWGGGTAFAEVALAKLNGFQTGLISGAPDRLNLIQSAGITAIDRSEFRDLAFDEQKIASDSEYAERYRVAEKKFLQVVQERTNGNGVSIFVDHIGADVTPATLKALSKPGVITTSGWKSGMRMSTNRALAAMNWQTHVHTHYLRQDACEPAVEYAEANGWLPVIDQPIAEFEEIPKLAQDYQEGKVRSYFPVFRVNAE